MVVQCDLCPKACRIAPGQSGECRIRVNLDGTLCATTYGHPCAVHVDPVEKKPLFHFLPGTPILSLATVGCNLHCKNCQNWEISQADPEETPAYGLLPEQLPDLARQYACASVAYTYTEPLVYYEYTLDCCRVVRRAGMRNAVVTAGYLNREPLRELYAWVDAANVDLKAYSDSFYRDICGASLVPVLDGLVLARQMGVWLEVTNLVLPTLNDSDRDFADLCRWMKANLGGDTPLHFSAFHPDYRLRNLPPTPTATLERARQVALAEGLAFVYVGNVSTRDGGNTFCPRCGELLLSRRGLTVVQNRLAAGRCPVCRTQVPGVWS